MLWFGQMLASLASVAAWARCWRQPAASPLTCHTISTDSDIEMPPVQVEECGLKLAHQFPWAASAYVAVGLALRRRELTYPDMPSSAPKRKQIMKVRLQSRSGEDYSEARKRWQDRITEQPAC
jgi:hypothetical protein